MIAKTFEVRDVGTFIPLLAVKLEPGNEVDRYLLGRAGYGRSTGMQAQYVMVWRLGGGDKSPATTDPYDFDPSWDSTYHHAHLYIQEHFDTLESGAVVDVEYIQGKSKTPKKSERERDHTF